MSMTAEQLAKFDRACEDLQALMLPVAEAIQRVKDIPYIPHWVAQSPAESGSLTRVDGPTQDLAQQLWLLARDQAVTSAEVLVRLGVHEQIAKQLLAPWLIAPNK